MNDSPTHSLPLSTSRDTHTQHRGRSPRWRHCLCCAGSTVYSVPHAHSALIVSLSALGYTTPGHADGPVHADISHWPLNVPAPWTCPFSGPTLEEAHCSSRTNTPRPARMAHKVDRHVVGFLIETFKQRCRCPKLCSPDHRATRIQSGAVLAPQLWPHLCYGGTK